MSHLDIQGIPSPTCTQIYQMLTFWRLKVFPAQRAHTNLSDADTVETQGIPIPTQTGFIRSPIFSKWSTECNKTVATDVTCLEKNTNHDEHWIYKMRLTSTIKAFAACTCIILLIFLIPHIDLWPGNFAGTKQLKFDKEIAATSRLEDQSVNKSKGTTLEQIESNGLQEVQRERLKRIENVCMNHQIKGEISWLFAYTPQKVSYCANHKVASTYWIQVFRFLHKEFPPGVRKPSEIPKFHAHLVPFTQTRKRSFKSKFDYEETMNNYRFMMAREPYQRLWSVYIDKYVLLDLYFWRQYSRDIRSTLLRGYENTGDFEWSKDKLGSSDRLKEELRPVRGMSGSPCKQLSFEEFLIYIVSTGRSSVFALDDHLQPVHVGCNPCIFKPDFVGKVETLTQEKSFLLEKLGLDPDIDGVANYEDRVRYEIRTLAEFEFHLFELARDACVTMKNLQERIITAFILNGYLDRGSLDVLRPQLPIQKSLFTDKLMDLFKTSQRTPEQAQEQREEIRKEAYRKIPYQTLLSLQQLFKYDFLLFDYNPRPDYIFENRVDFDISKILDKV
ncbi:carbohydrate sulfotransferase [Plakobranchus ocellatus]|uniref:Carbohydrate sulfotransferase n=1 Tax=Plakobranchus ocellatus TaxID=259542 RepID=A0AAV3Z9C5_9GAST|nr:carbohydrate sulfotransferase [Plakobranchus ocellatus]